MKTRVDAELCIGCGLCEQIAPLVFQMKEDKAIVVTDIVSLDAENACIEAKDSCPTTAIIIE